MNRVNWMSWLGCVLCIPSAVVVCGVSGCGVDGWNTANPSTVLRVDPVSKTLTFADNKDNDVQIEDLEWAGDTKTFKVKKVSIVNNASKVRESNAVQLQQLALQTQAIMVGLQNMANSLASIFPTAKVAAPAVVPTFPAVESVAQPTPATMEAP